MSLKPSWKTAPEWAQYLAQDGDGTWYWYEHRPSLSSDLTRVWARKDATSRQYRAPEDTKAWRETLERRP